MIWKMPKGENFLCILPGSWKSRNEISHTQSQWIDYQIFCTKHGHLHCLYCSWGRFSVFLLEMLSGIVNTIQLIYCTDFWRNRISKICILLNFEVQPRCTKVFQQWPFPGSEFPKCSQAQSYLCFTKSDWPVPSRDKGRWPHVGVVDPVFVRQKKHD